MRPSNQPLSEVTIKVPAPFAGISDLGFTAQYRSQAFQEPLRDVPLLIEGPPPPMRRLAELLQLLRGIDGSAYSPRNRRVARVLENWSGRRDPPQEWPHSATIAARVGVPRWDAAS